MGNGNTSMDLEENDNKALLKSSVNLKKSVKSIYIIKTIFSFLYGKRKLNIINYNKKYQNMLGINIEYYKNISGKEHIGKRNGKGEEYKLKTNLLVFEGTYSNGKKNGKGKEFYNYGKIKFEGKYLNGVKIEGKGYNENGDLILKLDKNGIAKEYYKNSKIKFEGEYFNGKRWNGKLYNYNGNIEIYRNNY